LNGAERLRLARGLEECEGRARSAFERGVAGALLIRDRHEAMDRLADRETERIREIGCVSRGFLRRRRPVRR